MKAQQLKNAILQEAIEGRLVPQDPNDEPASALLARIRKEKEQLVKAGKLKKKDLEVKPISEDEIPFEIPDSWEWVRLGAVISLLSGRDLVPQDYNGSNNGIPYITGATNFEDGQLIINRWTDKPITVSKKGDLLITCKGTIGTMAYNNVGEIHIARQVMAINTIFLNLDYIKYFLMRQVYELEKKAKSIIPGISREDVLDSLLPFPPLAEQHRIVAKIEELLPKVEEYGKAQDALNKLNAELPDRLKKSILQEAISGRLVPQDPNDEPASVLLAKIRKEKEQLVKEGKLKKKDLEVKPISEDEIPFEIPDTWEWVRVKDVFIINPKVIAEDDADAAFIPMEKIVACYGSKYSYEIRKWKDIKSSFTSFADGDVAFAKITPCFQNRKSMILENLPNGIGAGTTELKVLRQYSETMDRKYLLYFLASSYFVDEAVFKGTANQQRIIVGYLENKLFPLPPLAEQHRIVAKLEQVLSEIDKLKK